MRSHRATARHLCTSVGIFQSDVRSICVTHGVRVRRECYALKLCSSGTFCVTPAGLTDLCLGRVVISRLCLPASDLPMAGTSRAVTSRSRTSRDVPLPIYATRVASVRISSTTPVPIAPLSRVTLSSRRQFQFVLRFVTCWSAPYCLIRPRQLSAPPYGSDCV